MKTVRSLATLILSCSLLGCFPGLPFWTAGEVPFVPTPPEVVDRMLELAEVKTGDVLYDVGGGDGRIVIRAAKKYGTRGVGIEIDGELVDRSRAQAKRKVSIIWRSSASRMP
jgi:precorrin-6B methylase 2